jgi:pyruvate dehydrogenase E1 component beta subunit
VPSEEYLIPLGQADIRREGKDVTIVTYSAMVFKALAAAEQLSREGIEAEVIDLRTLVPLDEEAIINSVKKTGKLVIVHEAMERGGVAGEITAIVADKAFDYLDAPIKRVAALNVPLPHDAKLEALCIPQEKNIVEAVKSLL